MSARYPFSAISGQDELKLALLLTAVDPLIGGLLAFGDRGTGKSTAVRALAALLPEMRATTGCAYHCDPDSPAAQCATCRKQAQHKVRKIPIPVVDLPLGATEDRVIGALNLERACPWRESLRARTAGPGQPRLSLCRRSEPARGPYRRPAARRRRLGRERGGARGSQRPPSGALRAGRQRQSGRRRAPPATCLIVSASPSRCARRPTSPPGWRSSSAAMPSSAIRPPFPPCGRRPRTRRAAASSQARKRLERRRRSRRRSGARRRAVHPPQDRRSARPAHADARGPRACRLRRAPSETGIDHLQPHGGSRPPPSPAPQPAGRNRLGDPHRPRPDGSLRRMTSLPGPPPDLRSADAALAAAPSCHRSDRPGRCRAARRGRSGTG